MKSIDQLEHAIEVWHPMRLKWETCPDVRLLEPGDIVRLRHARTGKVVPMQGRETHVVAESLKMKMRTPTLREYQSLISVTP